MDNRFHEHILNILIYQCIQHLLLFPYSMDNHFHEHILNILNDHIELLYDMFPHPIDNYFHVKNFKHSN